MKYVFMALLGLALPVGAMAQPAWQPTRDVEVTYHLTGKTPPGTQGDTVKMGFTSGSKRTWVEPPGQKVRMIVDRPAGKMLVIMNEQHSYMEMPYDPKKVMTFNGSEAKFTRTGTATIAGVGCTTYDVQSPQQVSTVCLTDDGVLLKAVSGDPAHPGGLEAVSVRYGAQPASAFAAPDGYQKMDMSRMGRAPGG